MKWKWSLKFDNTDVQMRFESEGWYTFAVNNNLNIFEYSVQAVLEGHES